MNRYKSEKQQKPIHNYHQATQYESRAKTGNHLVFWHEYGNSNEATIEVNYNIPYPHRLKAAFHRAYKISFKKITWFYTQQNMYSVRSGNFYKLTKVGMESIN